MWQWLSILLEMQISLTPSCFLFLFCGSVGRVQLSLPASRTPIASSVPTENRFRLERFKMDVHDFRNLGGQAALQG